MLATNTQHISTDTKAGARLAAAAATAALWQHPYVDVFKHFKLQPTSDWKANKKQGDVQEIFAKEIGRKAFHIAGSISANNYIQLPHPSSLQKSLGLTGRYLYIQIKAPAAGSAPFTMHFDFGMADRDHGIRVSVSNLFKQFTTSNGQVIHVPLDLKTDRWNVVLIDIVDIIKRSQLFPQTYVIENAHTLRSMTLCANAMVRGVYTSDNVYEYITLPSDMRFKFSFDLSKWEEYFDWQALPGDWDVQKKSLAGKKGLTAGKSAPNDLETQSRMREEQRKQMSHEIDELLDRQKKPVEIKEEQPVHTRKTRINKDMISGDIGLTSERPVTGYIAEDKKLFTGSTSGAQLTKTGTKDPYVAGSYIGMELKRSPKLNQDPIMELKHIIGYSPDKCLNLKWSRVQGENVVIFTSGGTLIAMDAERTNQKRFFFGHSSPICCFDINANGSLIASAQEGKNSIVRIWDYHSGRCIRMLTVPVVTLKCLAFSYDGKYLASVGKDAHNKELIIVWDITRIGTDEKTEIVAKQTSDFNILALKFSPIDSSRMASCGKENIRFWRIKDNGSIRGSAIVLNHHARNTIFTTLDFEYGAFSVEPKENESLKRVFVGSKHGMIFQVNYHTESLEATYQTNDSAIYSISVNEAFCVTGSEDTYLRVWPLDFSEFFMEAKHEGTVCAVDISPDGLKVVCGTLNGSLGILDKPNQKYSTLLRSHTDQILQMDFHLAKRNIITVSKDKTIRLWDIDTFDQVYEFSSPIDQALSVAAHPYLPVFSCGFESGVLRVFDIERTCVADEFSQFNKPLTKLAYSPYGDLLVTCCVDGGVAVHNPKRQNLPIKMMHLEFPPEHVHVAFTSPVVGQSFKSSDENSDPNQSEDMMRESKFALMGEYGNNVNVYDSTTFFVKHQIQVTNSLLRSFAFANSNRELALVTTDCRIKVYSLAKYEGIFLREINTVHRGNISSISISNNSGYMLTGGEDCLLKLWDYEAHKTNPFYFQAFIGHTFQVKNVMFCPVNNNLIISAGEKDGIYLWQFYGDTQTQFSHQPLAEEGQKGATANKETLVKTQTVLERLRTTRKEAKQSQALGDASFILPSFKPLQQLDVQSTDLEFTQEQPNIYQQIRRDRHLSYNHYANATPSAFDIELKSEASSLADDFNAPKQLKQLIVNGYDGFGGVHNNLVWDSQEGWMAYTLHNKVIFENTKTREQTVLADSTVQLSTLTLSNDKRMLAVGEGRPNKKGYAEIFIYSTTERRLLQKLSFHQRGVQAIAFSNDARYMISIGVQGENALAIWDVAQGLVIKSSFIRHYAINQVKVDPYIDDGFVQFAIVGNQGVFTLGKLDIEQKQLLTYEVDNVPYDFLNSDFTSIAYTQHLGAPYNTYLILLGAADGSMTAYNQQVNQFVDGGVKKWCISGEIGHIRANNQHVVLASSTGTIARYGTHNNQVFPQDSAHVQILKTDQGAAVVSLAMDDLNNEGIAGTSSGQLYYLNFAEKLIIKIVNKAYHLQKEVTQVKFVQNKPQLFLTNCSESGSTAKLWTTNQIDQVVKLSTPTQSPIAFILSAVNGCRYSVIGHENGLLRLIHIETLKTEGTYQLAFESEGEQVSTAVFNPNGVNLAIGTNLGNVYIGSVKEDPATKKATVSFGKLDNISTRGVQAAVTSLQFSIFDPIGSFLVCFDNGTIKTWQGSVKNEQFLKIMELQQREDRVPLFDLSEIGYQQFDVIDHFDMFENPHGLDELTEDDKAQLKLLYSAKKYRQAEAKFSPGKTAADLYYSYVSALQYIYLRNYVQHSIVKRVSLLHFPTCVTLIDYNSLFISGGDDDTVDLNGGETVLALIGTKEGKVLVHKIASNGSQKLAETRAGLSFGSVTAIDYANTLAAVGTQSGEIFTIDVMNAISGEQQ